MICIPSLVSRFCSLKRFFVIFALKLTVLQMRNWLFIVFVFAFLCKAFAQHVEPARYEVERFSKDHDCRFELFGKGGGIVASQTDKADKDKNYLWNFAVVDTNLLEVRSDLIPLSHKMSLVGSASDERFAAFLFTNDKSKKADTISFCVVCYDRNEMTYKSFGEKLPERTLILSVDVMDGMLMMTVNNKDGNGFLLFFDLESSSLRSVHPALPEGFVLFQTMASAREHCFVVAAREYVDKRYKATSFLVYTRSGNLLHSYRYENMENANLGRLCFDFDAEHRLVVMGTLERESNKKVKLEGILEDFNKISIGVVWMKFGGTANAKIYLFKDMPEIELALTASDRVRVREERIRLGKKNNKEKKEIAFQFLPPRLVHYGDLSVFTAEAFVPEYHTETRMSHGFYNTYPYSYTVFDGYDFISEILLAFDAEGNLKWQTSVRFANELSFDLRSHSGEAVCHDELVVASPYKNALRYVVFDASGNPLLTQQTEHLEPLYGADYVEDEDFAEMANWYGSRFVIFGCQVLQNSSLPKPRRTSYFFQKVQYE